MNMSKNKTNRFMPFIMAFCVVIGIIIGTFFSNHFSGNRLNVINSGSNRLNNLLHLIDDQYVLNTKSFCLSGNRLLTTS